MPPSFRDCMHTGWFLTLTWILAMSAPLLAAATDSAVANSNAEADVASNLRVFYVRSRVFEYLFTGSSIGPNSNAAPLLYFRDLAGNTL